MAQKANIFFTTAQVAQKQQRQKKIVQFYFTTAQVAQKVFLSAVNCFVSFTTAQVAQKNKRNYMFKVNYFPTAQVAFIKSNFNYTA